jgi:stage II sporulation protein D
VVGVVAGEMPVIFHIEALKAQAVAARSYVLKRIEYNKNKDFDVVDTVINQVFLDNEHLKKSWGAKYANHILKIKTAVLMTKGEYIEYDGRIADALYFSTSNGFTENSEEIFGFEAPYLRSVESSWDQNTSPVFNDTKEYPLKDFCRLLNISCTEKISIKIIKRTSTGRILEAAINQKEMTGSQLVSILNLRSNDFKIEQEGAIVKIKTTGFGHGVGMSQYGAQGMANEGYLYDEILRALL